MLMDLVAPVIALFVGARRAGQGRASGERGERTLDAPKRSRTIGPERLDLNTAITAQIAYRTSLASTRSGLRRPAGE